MRYQPKRSSARWLEGAPRPVLACYDNGGRSCDRYTVLYGAPIWTPDMSGAVPYVAMNAAPFHPQGFGQHGEMPSINRSALGRKIRFLDLPNDCRRLVERDCREPTIIYDCEICDGFHPWNWTGDCRDDANRYASEDDYAARTNTPILCIEVRSMAERVEADAKSR